MLLFGVSVMWVVDFGCLRVGSVGLGFSGGLGWDLGLVFMSLLVLLAMVGMVTLRLDTR